MLRKILCLAALFSGAPVLANPGLEKVVAIQEARISQLEKQVQELAVALGRYKFGFVVFNSVANEGGSAAVGSMNTRQFWRIGYEDRFQEKGNLSVDLGTNYYNGSLYRNGPALYTDVIEDIEGKVAVVMTARAQGIDRATMRFQSPVLVDGVAAIFESQFAGGWSSHDHDGDTLGFNCAAFYSETTQHYTGCWIYSLGSDADGSGDHSDMDWGPHVHSATLKSLGLATDGTDYSRVRRITRFVR
jgi:hypothetical protein